jgi:hypothetical protein
LKERASSRFYELTSAAFMATSERCSRSNGENFAIVIVKRNDAAVKAEIDRLTAELKALPEKWSFVER